MKTEKEILEEYCEIKLFELPKRKSEIKMIKDSFGFHQYLLAIRMQELGENLIKIIEPIIKKLEKFNKK